MKSFKSINLLVFALSITEMPVFATSVFSIEDAAKKGLIKLSIRGKGGFTGDVIDMKIQNLTNQKLDLKVEAGRRLDSKNNNEQDILVTKPQEVFVGANQTRSVNIFGMCCQAHNSSPSTNSIYYVGKLADSNLIKLANFIDKNKYYTNYTAQEAVWTISDNNSLASISGDKDVKTNLQNYVSKITGRAIPPYNISYWGGSDGSAMGKANKIEGIFDYTVPADGSVTIGIYDTKGNLVQLLCKDLVHQKGECKLFYTFRTKNVPEGTYYARMTMNGMLQKEMKIEF